MPHKEWTYPPPSMKDIQFTTATGQHLGWYDGWDFVIAPTSDTWSTLRVSSDEVITWAYAPEVPKPIPSPSIRPDHVYDIDGHLARLIRQVADLTQERNAYRSLAVRARGVMTDKDWLMRLENLLGKDPNETISNSTQ